jgi:hypothetical protein
MGPRNLEGGFLWDETDEGRTFFSDLLFNTDREGPIEEDIPWDEYYYNDGKPIKCLHITPDSQAEEVLLLANHVSKKNQFSVIYNDNTGERYMTGGIILQAHPVLIDLFKNTSMDHYTLARVIKMEPVAKLYWEEE